MLVVRPAQIDDVQPLFDLIQLSELGLSTLKISMDRLTERVKESIQAFSQPTATPKGQPYVFVMEDLTHGKIVGTSAIYSKVGGFQPFYSYEIKTEIKESQDLGVRKEIPFLNLYKTHNGPTEIGSLFLSPDYWGSGHGRLLSLSRFLFMANFPDRFEDETIAELRGIVHADGNCPLWNALGSHFFQIEYPRAETLTLESKKFIAELLPTHPIYIPLLPKEAQDALGQVHDRTKPALHMLEQEGFQFQNLVDIFDGGPTVQCQTSEIRTIKQSRVCRVASIQKKVKGQKLLVANCELNFRATLGTVQLDDDDGAVIEEVTALRLNTKVNDRLRLVTIKAS